MTAIKQKKIAKAGSISERRLKGGQKSYTLRVSMPGSDGVWRRRARMFRTKREADECRRVIGRARKLLVRSKELGDWNLSL
jgi:hypothetical protein